MVTICTASLTFNNSTFCPHSAFMCFVWIWEQTAIISLYSINWLVYITETECIYCAVRAEPLQLTSVSISQSLCQSQTPSTSLSPSLIPSHIRFISQYAGCTFLQHCQSARCHNTEGYQTNRISHSVLNINPANRQYLLAASNNTSTPTKDAQNSLQLLGPSPNRPCRRSRRLEHCLFRASWWVSDSRDVNKRTML